MKVKEILTSLGEELPDYPILIDVHDCIFTVGVNGNNLYYNTDNNIEDLFNGDGNTYGGYLPEGYKENAKYLVANIDTQCGQWITEIFDVTKRVYEEDHDE